MRDLSSLEDRFVGCLLGLAVGDALGANYEGLPSEYIAKSVADVSALIGNPPVDELRYTDDTQMTIGVAETLVARGQIDDCHLCERFAANFVPQRRYGRGAMLVIEAMINGDDHRWLAENQFPGGSFGNGAAMRAAPVGLMFLDDHARLWDEARKSALPTHTHRLGIEGAQLLALAVALTASDTQFHRERFFATLESQCKSGEFSRPLRRAAKLDDPRDLPLLGNGIEATSSVVTAIATFSLSPNSYADTIGRAIFLGGDTDTIAAMAGAISGAYLGRQAIPSNLLQKLEDLLQGRTYIENLARQLYAAHANRTGREKR